MPSFSEPELLELVRRVILALGSSFEEADAVAKHLVRANVVGHDSHGIGMLPAYVHLVRDGLIVPNQTLKTLRDATGVLVFDGGRGFGMSMAAKAVGRAIHRAHELGTCLLALRNSSHIGRVGTYGEQAAAEGCCFISYVNVTDHHPIAVPWGASEARLGTNPFVTALPGPAGTILLDMATTAVAAGKVRVAHAQGRHILGDYLLDANGEPTHDPKPFVEQRIGGLRTFGEHKGSGLSTLCELLAGAVGGGQRADEPTRGGILNSMFAILINLSHVDPLDTIQQRVAVTRDYLHASRGHWLGHSVLLPGEPELSIACERTQKGIFLDDSTWQKVRAAAAMVGIESTEAAMGRT